MGNRVYSKTVLSIFEQKTGILLNIYGWNSLLLNYLQSFKWIYDNNSFSARVLHITKTVRDSY